MYLLCWKLFPAYNKKKTICFDIVFIYPCCFSIIVLYLRPLSSYSVVSKSFHAFCFAVYEYPVFFFLSLYFRKKYSYLFPSCSCIFEICIDILLMSVGEYDIGLKNKRTKFSAFWVVGFLSPCRKIDVYDMFYCRWHCASFSFVKCCYSVHKVRYDWIYSSLNYMCMFRRCCKPTLIC